VKRKEEIPGQILQAPFVKFFVEDRAQDLPERFSVEATVQDPFIRLSAQGVCRRSPQKIFVRDLKVRSLFKLSKPSPSKTSALFTRSLHKISIRGLPARSLYKISIGAYRSSLCTDLLKRSLDKTSGKDIYTRSLGKISL